MMFAPKTIIFLMTTIMLVNTANIVNADDLGTVFTSREQRQILNDLRNKAEQQETVITSEVAQSQETVLEETLLFRQPVIIKGVVHRESKQKSTAWFHKKNEAEEHWRTEAVQIPSNKIDHGQVNIIMPDGKTPLKVKVGEMYHPSIPGNQVLELVEQRYKKIN